MKIYNDDTISKKGDLPGSLFLLLRDGAVLDCGGIQLTEEQYKDMSQKYTKGDTVKEGAFGKLTSEDIYIHRFIKWPNSFGNSVL